ncbi:unnamed protein product [Brassica rapa]|uniref:Uncharacterized protein n=1 Tax=Brassica campestris TaxID=3711 RepID=A0A8D9D777_BRACM|nr:unnamed protein product [Brassica rapa]
MDSHGRHVCTDGHTRTHTHSHERPMCADRHTQTPRGPKSPEQSTGRASVQSPRTNVPICVLMDSHERPVCADGHTRTATDVLCMQTDTHRSFVCADGHPRTSCTHTDTHGCPPRTSCVCWRTPMDVLCVLNRQPTWDKITQTVHGKGQRAESKDERADMCTEGQPRPSYTDTDGDTRTATDVLCVLTHTDSHGRPVYATDTHGRPVCADRHPRTSSTGRHVCADGHTRTATDVPPRGQKSPKLSTGRASVQSPRTTVLICVLMDSHRHPVCADRHTRTATDVLCMRRTDTHGRPVCADRHPRTQPTWAKITQTVHGKGQRQRAYMCTDGQPHTDVLCVLTNTHRRHVCADGHPRTSCLQPTRAKITRTVHMKGQSAESKDQRTDMSTDGQPQTSSTNVLCVLTDTHERPPTWAKITQTVHGKGQRAESKDQRADMYTDGQPWTSCVC